LAAAERKFTQEEGLVMRKNLLIALAAGVALALTVAPGFAAENGKPSDSSGGASSGGKDTGSSKTNCSEILANKSAHSAAEVKACSG
jgi:hypothetical protein